MNEGFRGMYRGLGPLILGYLPTWTVYFTVYEKAKGVLEPGERYPFFNLPRRNLVKREGGGKKKSKKQKKKKKNGI